MKFLKILFLFFGISLVYGSSNKTSYLQKRFDLVEKSKSKKSLKNFSFKHLSKNSTNNTGIQIPSVSDKIKSRFRSLSPEMMNLTRVVKNKYFIRNSKILQMQNLTIENQCWTEPCLNGASCYGSSYSYFCDCPIGFVGFNCEINSKEKKLCGDGSCFNNGVCSPSDENENLYKCICFDGFTGLSLTSKESDESDDLVQEVQNVYRSKEKTTMVPKNSNKKHKSTKKAPEFDFKNLLKQEEEFSTLISKITQSHIDRIGEINQKKFRFTSGVLVNDGTRFIVFNCTNPTYLDINKKHIQLKNTEITENQEGNESKINGKKIVCDLPTNMWKEQDTTRRYITYNPNKKEFAYVLDEDDIKLVLRLDLYKLAPEQSKKINDESLIVNILKTFLIKIQAYDSDINENSRLTYHLINNETNSSSTPFQIKSDTSEIYAKRILNREHKDFYVLNIAAVDNGPNRLTTTTQLFVRVVSQFDFQPRLDSKIYNLTLDENTGFTKRPVILKVHGSDRNSNSSYLTYSLSGSLNDLNTFEIDNLGNVRLLSKLNFKMKNVYKLNVYAQDLAQPSCSISSELNIYILNKNLNIQSFSAPFYEFIAFENIDVGSKIGRVLIAYDRDLPDSQINFSLDSNFQDDLPFRIESNGSIITVKKLHKKIYEFYVSAVKNSISSSVNFQLDFYLEKEDFFIFLFHRF
ncbi:unnamed protein product [Brachionus calyciflorus]|uniref:Uncharacterized protein n=1 Tax=Brachionus calyciflorus TaxID=104777 RepID=A0A813Y4Y4_9BILA|nr:unnamed protein product [Brachionus calyciflorus]